MQTKRFSQITVAAVVLVSLMVLFWIGREAAQTIPLESAGPEAASISVQAPLGTLKAIVASTTEARARGLSGFASLPKDSGMLFVFQTAGVIGFWMREMNFPIDIVWIDADKRVSGVAPGISPETYPEIFYPREEIMYVLELNSGGAKEYGIATGTKLVF